MTLKVLKLPELTKFFPAEVKILFQIFNSEILLVGGCVRDLLLKKKIADFDFATKLRPNEIIKILEENNLKAIPTGIKFGTITAVVNHKNFEITTLRKDNETDGRHCEPEFIDDYELDAARRDFTVNAIYLDEVGNIYDYFDGISDLNNQEIKFIDDANKRIEEDYLRILRFFRFSCKYAKNLDKEGLIACVLQKENLKKLSRERIRSEFLKIIGNENKANLLNILQVLKDQEISAEIFSARLEIQDLARLFEIEKKLEFSADLKLKLAALFLNETFDLKVFAQEICATNLEKKYLQLVNFYSASSLNELKILLAFEEKNLVLNIYLFTLAKSNQSLKTDEVKKNLEFFQNFSLPNFPLNGYDLTQLGFKGSMVGDVIKKAKVFWAQNGFLLKKEDLIKFVIDLETSLK
jgi:poly(A) polymerase